MMMITSLEAQIEAQKESQNIVHCAQVDFLGKLKALKQRMEETLVDFDGTQMSLWEFSKI